MDDSICINCIIVVMGKHIVGKLCEILITCIHIIIMHNHGVIRASVPTDTLFLLISREVAESVRVDSLLLFLISLSLRIVLKMLAIAIDHISRVRQSAIADLRLVIDFTVVNAVVICDFHIQPYHLATLNTILVRCQTTLQGAADRDDIEAVTISIIDPVGNVG